MKASDGLHGVNVELLASCTARFDVGLDAAVGDGERLAVGEQDHLVRADAERLQLADALVALRGVIDAEEAVARLVVVLGRVEQAPVGREHAVAVEVAVRRRREQHRLAPAPHIEGERERAGAAREHHRLAACGVERDVVAAVPQRQLAHDRAVEPQHHDRVGAIRAPACGDEVATTGVHRIIRR